MQESLGHKVKKAVEAKMEALTTVYDSHKQSDRERQMAVRYHRVGSLTCLGILLLESYDESLLPGSHLQCSQ